MSDERISFPSNNPGRQSRPRGRTAGGVGGSNALGTMSASSGGGRLQPGTAPGLRGPFQAAQGVAPTSGGNMQLQPGGVFVPYAHDAVRNGQQQFWEEEFLPPSPSPPPQMIVEGEFSPRPPRPQTIIQMQQPQQANQQYVPPRAYQSKPQCPPGPEPPIQARRFLVGSLTAPPRRGEPRIAGYGRGGQIGQSENADPNAGYGALIRNKPDANAIPPMGIDIGMIEICTFFPSWLLIPDVSMRAIRNGWTRRDLAKTQLHAMGVLNKANLKTAEERIQKQISEGGRLFCNMGADERWDSERRAAEWESETDLTGHMWQLRSEYIHPGGASDWAHVPLATAANDVANWPTQQDELLMTRCVRFAVANPHLRLDTSHYHLIIQSQGWLYPNPPMDDDHDRQAVNRLRQNVNDPPN